MADKMMRIAGRDSLGKAKAIQTNSDGVLHTSTNIERQAFPTSTFQSGQEYVTPIKNSYGRDKLVIQFYFFGALELYIQYVNKSAPGFEYQTEPFELIYSNPAEGLTGFKKYHIVEVDLKYHTYKLKIVNKHNYATRLDGDNIEILGYRLPKINETINVKSNMESRQLFVPKVIGANDHLLTDKRSSLGYTYSNLNFYAFGGFQIYVKYLQNSNDREADWELVYNNPIEGYGNSKEFHSVSFRLKYHLYQLKFVNKHGFGIRLDNDTKEILSDEPLFEEFSLGLNNPKLKVPETTLNFKPISVDVKVGHKGYDGKFYILDSNNVIKTYDSITDGSSATSTGVNLNSLNITISHIIKTPQAIVYYGSDGTNACIYSAANISTIPTLKFQSTSTSFSWFEVDYNVDGVNGMILSGAYGAGTEKRELVLTTDGGLTFKTIKTTAGVIENPTEGQEDVNSHWHGVAIDVTSGYLYALEGDHTDRAAIWCSKDLGATWRKLDVMEGINQQPTLVIPFRHNVAFVRDGDHVGIDGVTKPTNPFNSHGLVHEVIEFNNQNGWEFFGRSKVHTVTEAYVTFQVQKTATRPIMVATGDGGASWHQVYFGMTNVGKLFGQDDRHIYVYGDTDGTAYYAEKLNWVDS